MSSVVRGPQLAIRDLEPISYLILLIRAALVFGGAGFNPLDDQVQFLGRELTEVRLVGGLLLD